MLFKLQRNLGNTILIYNEDRSVLQQITISKKKIKEIFCGSYVAYWEAEIINNELNLIKKVKDVKF